MAPSGSRRLLVSESLNGTFRVWRLKDGAAVAVLKHGGSVVECIGVVGTTLAYLDRVSNFIHVWGLDEDALYDSTVADSVRYRNAKVVLVGDSGAGKSGLGLVRSGGRSSARPRVAHSRSSR